MFYDIWVVLTLLSTLEIHLLSVFNAVLTRFLHVLLKDMYTSANTSLSIVYYRRLSALFFAEGKNNNVQVSNG